MQNINRFEQIVSIAAITLLVGACFVVLKPFVVAVIWAAILCFVTWPLYSILENWLGKRRTVAAALMTLMISLVVVVPLGIIGMSLADSFKIAISSIFQIARDGLPEPPQWIERLPIVGSMLYSHLTELAHHRENTLSEISLLLSKSKSWFVARGFDLGQGAFQLILSVFISFFFYRDGVMFVEKLQSAIDRVVGDRTQRLLAVTTGTIKGVVYGILGTALVQGVLAGLGFWFMGVPVPILLGLLTFFLALFPAGAPFVWFPASIWLFYKAGALWGFISLIYGFLVVSGVDNFLKPYLISRESHLPFILVFLGILGGMIAFGFIGLFLGPTLLAVGYSLLQEWCTKPSNDHA